MRDRRIEVDRVAFVELVFRAADRDHEPAAHHVQELDAPVHVRHRVLRRHRLELRVTPIPNSLAVPLIEGIVEPVLADTTRARALMPGIVPMPYRDAVSAVLERADEAETRWSGALHAPNAVELTDREGAERRTTKRAGASSSSFQTGMLSSTSTMSVGAGTASSGAAWNVATSTRRMATVLASSPAEQPLSGRRPLIC